MLAPRGHGGEQMGGCAGPELAPRVHPHSPLLCSPHRGARFCRLRTSEAGSVGVGRARAPGARLARSCAGLALRCHLLSTRPCHVAPGSAERAGTPHTEPQEETFHRRCACSVFLSDSVTGLLATERGRAASDLPPDRARPVPTHQGQQLGQ